jgi:hypothetical protein
VALVRREEIEALPEALSRAVVRDTAAASSRPGPARYHVHYVKVVPRASGPTRIADVYEPIDGRRS